MPTSTPLRRVLGALALLFVVGVTPACGNPCEEIAELACQKGGEASPECKKTREHAASASADDKAACETVLSLVQSVNKQ